jgi:hypothetical protein
MPSAAEVARGLELENIVHAQRGELAALRGDLEALRAQNAARDAEIQRLSEALQDGHAAGERSGGAEIPVPPTSNLIRPQTRPSSTGAATAKSAGENAPIVLRLETAELNAAIEAERDRAVDLATRMAALGEELSAARGATARLELRLDAGADPAQPDSIDPGRASAITRAVWISAWLAAAIFASSSAFFLAASAARRASSILRFSSASLRRSSSCRADSTCSRASSALRFSSAPRAAAAASAACFFSSAARSLRSPSGFGFGRVNA